jgi:Methyltransferase domain
MIDRVKKFSRTLGRLLGQSHRAFLIEILPKNSVGAEVGVHKGDFSAQLLQGVNPKELHLIDPWKHEESDAYQASLYGGRAQGGQPEMDDRYQSVCARFERDIRMGRLKIHRGYSTDVLNEFPDEYFDWIYIDGNHLYEFVRQDLDLSFKKTKLSGYITGDDYASGGWWQGGVKRAVSEFMQVNPVKLVERRNGQFIIKK